MKQRETHDQHFKNLFLDFPEEALEWLLPRAIEEWGPVQQVEFVRQEPKKQRLSDAHLALDMPILFTFRQHQLLLWLVEFQEDKAKFSIFKLAHYTLDMLEAYPKATVVPTVLFTARTQWRKDVVRELATNFHEHAWLRFKYVFVKLFDFQAADYYHIDNPVVKILLPKMNYPPGERWVVFWHALVGLRQLVSMPLFIKYIDFIEIYTGLQEDEQKAAHHILQEHQEVGMLKEIIFGEEGARLLDEHLEYGRKQGMEQGMEQGILKGEFALFDRQFRKKFQRGIDEFRPMLNDLRPEDILELGEYLLDCESVADLQRWIEQRRRGNLS